MAVSAGWLQLVNVVEVKPFASADYDTWYGQARY
jgi:hypothetical protein